MKFCWLFHEWSKWERIDVGFAWQPPQGGAVLRGTKPAQERICSRCGKREREILDVE